VNVIDELKQVLDGINDDLTRFPSIFNRWI
jgi:hypothetical protein